MKPTILRVDSASSVPKYRQVIDAITLGIEHKRLKVGDKLPSITELCNNNRIGRDTVLLALNYLKSKGIITSHQGKGYFISSAEVKCEERIMIIFHEISNHTHSLFHALIGALDSRMLFDVCFYNNDRHRLSKIIDNNSGKYSTYILVAKASDECQSLINSLPDRKIVLFDRPGNGAVQNGMLFHDYAADFEEILLQLKDRYSKYNRLVFMHQSENEPYGRVAGFKRFCEREGIDFKILGPGEPYKPELMELYFVSGDKNLAALVRTARSNFFDIGKNFGIVSFDEAVLKEVILGGLTTIDTDYVKLGSKMADCVVKMHKGSYRVRPVVKLRNSL